MGTNYYLHEDCCPHCQRPANVLHIGKSSWGWCFSLHVHPEEGLNSLRDWKRRWGKPGQRILNEEDEEVSPAGMLKIITKRKHPSGLSRHELDGKHCVGHGVGTWDLIKGEFS